MGSFSVNPVKYLKLAADVSRLKDDHRTYFLGGIGIRRDGVLVAACNGNPRFPTPAHHCEYRLARKLGKQGVVFLARTSALGTWCMAKPCKDCQGRLRASMVRKVYYTVDVGTYACWIPV
jgi:hypothetical protein